MGNCTGLCSNNQVSKTICKEEDLAIEECLSSTHEV